MVLTKNYITRLIHLDRNLRRFSKQTQCLKKNVKLNDDPKKIRNIGILAHIDAGKTTTTERMLFFSGSISHMGEVHHGNTVTDFMEQERERGITITAASVTFDWKKHKINLLDTPGHIDFTMEVEQTLNVMDGAVVILDGSAGVEAQTLTVWKQANRYNIPRIIYVNKMDKSKADLDMCQDLISKQLNATPLALQLPVFNEAKMFRGMVDLLSLEKFEWREGNFTKRALTPEDGKLWEDSINAKIQLIETLADLDDNIAEIVINGDGKLEAITSSVLQESLRNVTLNQKGVVILCGSSYKNIGVQCLLDAIIQYLPSPFLSQSQNIMQWFGDNLCAKAFKVRHDEFKGPITFFRVYAGSIHKGQKLFNIKKERPDHCEKLFIAYADDYEEVHEVGTGNVCAVTGLKHTSTGELVTSSSGALQSVQRQIKSKTNKDWKEILPAGPLIPDPVFFCSIEAPSLRHQAVLDKALAELEREDPSLKVTVNEETRQTVLGGMGELHIEIIRDRIKKEYKIDAELGALQIAYREKLIDTTKETIHFQHQMSNSRYSVKMTMSTVKCPTTNEDKNKLLLDRSPDAVENTLSVLPKHLAAIKDGVEKALLSGPKLYSPVVDVKVMLHHLETAKGTPDSIMTSATVHCVKKLLKNGETRLLEPFMLIEIACDEKDMVPVINDLSRRRGESTETFARASDVVIRGLVPLSELLGYATELRILTSGRALFSMELHSFREMTPEDEIKAIKSVTGF